ncbi:MAG: hypothetical protein GY809_06690 [Planctomycetes bacterium]|nr:hypothetical protein [Planctomycetota bacterium]
MHIQIKRWPHHWIFFGVCTAYLAQVTEPSLLYSGFGSVLPHVSACPTNFAFLGDALSRPGGLVFAITCVLSQCFISSWPGALAIMLTGLALSELARRHFRAAGFGNLTVLTCLPVITIILTYSRYKHPLLGVLVVCLGLFSAWILALVPRERSKLGVLLLCVTTVATFWLGGTGAWIVCLAMTLIHALRGRQHGMALTLGLPMSLVIIWILLRYSALTDVSQAWPLTLPHTEPVTGGMKTFSKRLMIALYGIVPGCLSVLLLGRWAYRGLFKKPRKHKKTSGVRPSKGRLVGMAQTVTTLTLPFVILGLSLHFSHDPLSKAYVQIHTYGHLRQWDDVLAVARQLPKGQTNVYIHHAIVRALSHTGRLPLDLLNFPQTQQGVFLTHETSVSALTQLKLHDLFLDLGQVNMAEKQASELLASDVEFGFIYERLAWIHIIKEQYDTARIFVNALNKNPLHRKAADALAHTLIHGLPADQVKRIERIRACMPTHREPVPEQLDQMLIQLLDHNPDNQMAFEYLMTLYCVTGQVHKVAQWLPHAARFNDPVTPPLYQEAALIHFASRKQAVDTNRIPIAPETIKRYERFMQLNTAFRKTRKKALLNQLIREFGSSYFFYLAFGQVGVK